MAKTWGSHHLLFLRDSNGWHNMTFIDNILNYDDGIDDRNNVHRPQPLKKDDKMDTIFCMKIRKQICEKKQLEPHVHLHPPTHFLYQWTTKILSEAKHGV